MRRSYLSTRWGGTVDDPSLDEMREALDELDVHDVEHPDAWVVHESGWSLSAHESGLLVWEAAESEAPPRHMSRVSRERVLELWAKLAEGRVDDIEAEPWCPGYGIEPLPEDERLEIEASWQREERSFYDSLGSERQDQPCGFESCSRGSVSHSRFCRVHHFEMMRQKTCPFTD